MTERTAAPRAAEPATGLRRVCLLAEGGMGSVELVAREEGRFSRLYARKRLRESLAHEPELQRMFLEEARLAGLLRHAHVVSVLDVGEDARGPYLLMDYVDGVSVGDLTKASARTGVPVPLQIALQIVLQAARGLHAAHELRDASGRPLALVHRDVSPQNLLIGYDGTTRVTDFGIAKAYGSATQTATGVLKGKLGYLSPEQLRFEEPDRRSDLFSLGVVLFELLAARRLYKSRQGNDGPRRILHEPPPDIGEHREDAPPALVALLFSMLAKDPAQRPATAAEVADRLEALWLEEVQLEGKLDLGAYLREAFAERREAQEARIVAAREASARERSPARAHRRSRRASVSPLGVAALGAAALAAGAIVVAAAGWAMPGLGLSSPDAAGTGAPAGFAAPPSEAPETTEAATAARVRGLSAAETGDDAAGERPANASGDDASDTSRGAAIRAAPREQDRTAGDPPGAPSVEAPGRGTRSTRARSPRSESRRSEPRGQRSRRSEPRGQRSRRSESRRSGVPRWDW